MNFNKTILSAATSIALLSMMACNSTDEEILTPDPVVCPEAGQSAGTHYLNIKIHLNGSETRAEDGGFEPGSSLENRINSLLLTFYDQDGKYLSYETYQEKDVSKGSVKASFDKKQIPARVLAWANIDDSKSLFTGLNLTDAVAQVCGSGYANAAGYFKMTSSSYMENDHIIYGSAIKSSDLFDNPKDSINASTVHVYLERLAAKIQINKNEKIDVKLPTYNNVGVSFTLKGMALNGVNKSTYYVKNIADYGFSSQLWQMNWNAPNLHRSYWSTDPNYIETGSNLDAYNYRTYQEITKNNYLTEYCLENTSGNAEFNIQNATHVLIVGQYKLQGVKRGSNLYLFNGRLMTSKNYRALIRSKYNYYTKSADEKYKSLPDSLYVIMRHGEIGKDASNVRMQLKLVDSDVVYVKTDGKYEQLSVADANAQMAKEADAVKYGQGKCYYAVPVQHLGKEGQIGQYGVVRNHYYQIAITELNNFGTGIWDPGIDPDDPEADDPDEDDDPEKQEEEKDEPSGDEEWEKIPVDPDDPTPDPGEPIVPEPIDPIKEYYVSLKIKVLDWKTIAQDIDL